MSDVSGIRGGIWGRIEDFFRAYADLLHVPRAFWIMVGTFSIESMAYFGVLTLMTIYLSTDLGWGDARATLTVSLFTMTVTLFMLGAGSYAEGFGLRRALTAGLLLCVVGRICFSLAPGHATAVAVIMIVGALTVVALGEAIIQPVCYSGVKQYTNKKTSSMGYALIYAIMNLGIVGIGAISAWVRPDVQKILDARKAGETLKPSILDGLANITGSGVQAVNWVCAGITAVTLIGFLLVMTRGTEKAKLRPDTAEKIRETQTRTLGERFVSYFAEGPFTNVRFLFFVFMLLPVQTLFAHQWLTMPTYILRAYSEEVGNRMEWLVNWTNPAIIFVGVPLFTALTRRVNIYTMILLGTFVSAAPTFLLAIRPNLSLLITYLVLFSIGEALWSARFLEYASELAPEGRVAQYMGLANVPWLLAKGTTGFYAGWLLETFCPKDTPRESLHTETLWLIYGCIAMATPIGLLLARKWVKAGLQVKSKAAVATEAVPA